MNRQYACLTLGLWLCHGARSESSLELCETCELANTQLLQTQEALSKESKEEASHEEEEEKKELEIGENDYGKTKDIYKCVSHRKGWYCPEDSGNPANRLNDKDKDYSDRFKIFWDTSKNKMCAKRIGAASGWGMKLKIACQGNSNMKTISFGRNNLGGLRVCAEEKSAITCDSDAGDKHKRVKDTKYRDKFDITVRRREFEQGMHMMTTATHNEVCADRKGANGWGLDLKIQCAKDAELIRPLSNMELCAAVSGGKLMSGQDLVFESCAKTNTMNQLFTYDEGTSQIKLLRNPGVCFHLWEGNDARTSQITTWKCENEEGENDKWLLKDSKIIFKKNPIMCMGVGTSFAPILTNCTESTTNILVGYRAFTPTQGAALIRPLQDMELCVDPTVDVFGGKRKVQQDMILQKCKEGAAKLNQVFHVSATGQIKLFGALDLCLNIWGGKIEPNTMVKTWGCKGKDAADDKWSFEDNQIKVKANKSLCLGVGEFKQDEKLKLVDCDMKLNAFHVTGEEKMDCPWKTPNSNPWKPTCGDKQFHDNCVTQGLGQRIQCPFMSPKMCRDKSCGGDTDHCCETSCNKRGGERPC